MRNAVDNVARVRVAHLPSTTGSSRVPQLGGAAASACSTVIPAPRPPKVERWPARSFFTISLPCSERDFEPAVGSVRTPTAVRSGRGVRRCVSGKADRRPFLSKTSMLRRAEFHGTLKMRLSHFSLSFRTLEFDALGMNRASGSATADGDNPGKTNQIPWSTFLVRQRDELSLRQFFAVADSV
jgi:hypothetical protein